MGVFGDDLVRVLDESFDAGRSAARTTFSREVEAIRARNLEPAQEAAEIIRAYRVVNPNLVDDLLDIRQRRLRAEAAQVRSTDAPRADGLAADARALDEVRTTVRAMDAHESNVRAFETAYQNPRLNGQTYDQWLTGQLDSLATSARAAGMDDNAIAAERARLTNDVTSFWRAEASTLQSQLSSDFGPSAPQPGNWDFNYWVQRTSPTAVDNTIDDLNIAYARSGQADFNGTQFNRTRTQFWQDRYTALSRELGSEITPRALPTNTDELATFRDRVQDDVATLQIYADRAGVRDFDPRAFDQGIDAIVAARRMAVQGAGRLFRQVDQYGTSADGAIRRTLLPDDVVRFEQNFDQLGESLRSSGLLRDSVSGRRAVSDPAGVRREIEAGRPVSEDEFSMLQTETITDLRSTANNNLREQSPFMTRRQTGMLVTGGVGALAIGAAALFGWERLNIVGIDTDQAGAIRTPVASNSSSVLQASGITPEEIPVMSQTISEGRAVSVGNQLLPSQAGEQGTLASQFNTESGFMNFMGQVGQAYGADRGDVQEAMRDAFNAARSAIPDGRIDTTAEFISFNRALRQSLRENFAGINGLDAQEIDQMVGLATGLQGIRDETGQRGDTWIMGLGRQLGLNF